MDAIALLCNLYADGPTTRSRLVDAGWTSLPRVEAAPLEILAELLGGGGQRAQRFQREAALLRERLEAGEPDAEEASPREPPPVKVRSSPAPAPARIAPGSIDGLDGVTCDLLAVEGVESLEALAGADALALAQTSGLPITHVLHLRFLARRATGEVRPEPERADEPAEREAAGPFA